MSAETNEVRPVSHESPSPSEIARSILAGLDESKVNPPPTDMLRQVWEDRNRLADCLKALGNTVVREADDIEQTLGRALGYPRFADDPVNFPGESGDRVCVGPNAPASLASEAAERIGRLTEERDFWRARTHDGYAGRFRDSGDSLELATAKADAAVAEWARAFREARGYGGGVADG